MHWARWAALCKPKELGGVGFQHIRSFNNALLAKQVWRMLQNPDSLVSRVFRARYCKSGKFLEAEVKSNASFVWRSLVWSRDVIREGSVWRMGYGRDISVWRDNWVADLEGPISGAGEPLRGEDEKVSDLLAEDGSWNHEKVEGLFSPFVQELILNTPVGEMGNQDVQNWKFDDRGSFLVKLAYLLAINFYKADPHVSEPDRKRWSRLVWNVSIPPKARVFLWRAFNNFIPTAANLRTHHIPTSSICGLCGDRWGSTEHCLLYCPKVKRIWKNSRFTEVLRKGDGILLVDVAAAIRKKCGVEDYDLWSLMVWQVWNFVCKLLHPDDGELSRRSRIAVR